MDTEDFWRLDFEFDGLKKISIRESWGADQLGIGATLWPGAVKLSEYLVKHPDIVRGKRVLELGSGCAGLTGIVSVMLGSKLTLFTDLEPLLEPLFDNVTENISERYELRILDWRNPPPLQEMECDVVFACDCIYDIQVLECFLSLLLLIGKPCYLSGIIGDAALQLFYEQAQPNFDIQPVVESSPLRSVYLLTSKPNAASTESLYRDFVESDALPADTMTEACL
ncbi:putative methyltransferase-domain-containing protein [Gorgonomyces haynaldii]|nr:putative methyltransferase-domain-containing protein [Gorgonomyces haynaldii]